MNSQFKTRDTEYTCIYYIDKFVARKYKNVIHASKIQSYWKSTGNTTMMAHTPLETWCYLFETNR